MRTRRTVAVYVDGFALYKALLQRRYPQYKWLDLETLARRLFPHRDVVQVKYFTAPLKPMTNDPGVGQRQQIYWRALATTNVDIITGTFSFVKQPYSRTTPTLFHPSRCSLAVVTRSRSSRLLAVRTTKVSTTWVLTL